MTKYSTVTKMIEALLIDQVKYSNQEIVDLVRIDFPDAKTSTKSVASVASTMRRFGIDVAKRDPESPNERIKELEGLLKSANEKIAELEALIEGEQKVA